MASQKLLVSVNNYSIEGVKCIKSFKNIDWKDVECLIFHSSSDSDMEIMLTLSKIKGVVPKVIYINSFMNPLYYCIFTGLNADIYDDEQHLLDDGILNFLVDSYKETGMTIKPPNTDVETLAKSIAIISSSNVDNIQKLVNNPFWVKTLDTAVSNVDSAIERASQANINMVDFIREATKYIESLEDGQYKTTQEIEKLKKYLDEIERKQRPNAPFIFSTYTVPVSVPRVLYIKVVGHCRFLTSFIIAYQHYLKMKKQYSSKILLALPKLKLYMVRYKEMSRLAPDSIDIMNVSASDMYVTYEPKKIVLDTFFGQSNINIFIVIDMLLGDNLIEGHMVETFTAGSGVSDVKRFNLTPKRTILPMVGVPDCLIIPYINGYVNSNEHTRITHYFERCNVIYEKLDMALSKNGR